MQWPEYQVPSLAGHEEGEQMQYDGMRGLGDIDLALRAAGLPAEQALALAKSLAIKDAKARAKAQVEFYARCNSERDRNGLPRLPGSVYLDLANRGVDPGTAPIRVPTGPDGKELKNPDGTYVIHTITPSGQTEPGANLPPPPGDEEKKGAGMSPVKIAVGVGVLVGVGLLIKKFA